MKLTTMAPISIERFGNGPLRDAPQDQGEVEDVFTAEGSGV